MLTVADFLDDNGWDVGSLKGCLPMDTVLSITAIFARKNSSIDDKMVWEGSPNGIFSTKYKGLVLDNRETNWGWQFIWILSVLSRCKSFL